MLPPDVASHIQKIDAKIKSADATLSTIESQSNPSDYNQMIIITSNYVVIATAGLIETGLQSILLAFCSKKCAPQLKRYLESNLKRQTTMNCEKIEKLLKKFDPSWANNFCTQIQNDQKTAIDSIKSIRDNIAHGKHDGTGLNIVKGYYQHSKNALQLLAEIIT